MATSLEIQRTVRAISIDLDYAIAFYETYVPSGQDPGLIERINTVEFYPAFNIISDSLQRNVILALCRIWGTRSDTACLTRLADEFRDAQILADLAGIGHKVDASFIARWLAEVDAVSKSDELLALKRARHRALAHTATPNEPYKGKARVAAYGDERVVLEKTVPLVEQAGEFIGYTYARPYAEQHRLRQEHAKKFWDQIIPAAGGR